ncbi:MAG: IS4 family transposase [bacterium]|nr:IS4 family transposase [bacterium]
MARTAAGLPEGTRLTDFISLGALAGRFPLTTIHRVLEETGRQSQRQRQLPAHVMVYYVIGLALYMQVSYGEVLRCLVEGLEWLGLPVQRLRKTGKSGISQARMRLGAEPMRRLYTEWVQPIATPETQGAWYRRWRIVSIDGSTLDVADTEPNERAFGRPGASRGRAGFPKIRFVTLAENGTHVMFSARVDAYTVGENTLAREVLAQLRAGMLCLADRGFFSYALWKLATSTGADLVWRARQDQVLPCISRLEDGSYLSRIYPSAADRERDRNGIDVRVVEYRLDGAKDATTLYRLLTTILAPEAAPGEELAALYHERWEIEGAFDEFKTHLRGRQIVLRSKSPELVLQEFHGLMLAHFAIRSLMHEAALKADVDPDTLSFTHSVRVVRRKLPRYVSIPPSGAEAPPSSDSG